MDHRLLIYIYMSSKQEKEWCTRGTVHSNYMEVKHWRSFYCSFLASFLPRSTTCFYQPFFLAPVYFFTVTTMARPMKATWIPWSGVYSYIPGIWSTWWRKGQSYIKQSETEQTGLTSCYFQGNWPGGFWLSFFFTYITWFLDSEGWN